MLRLFHRMLALSLAALLLSWAAPPQPADAAVASLGRSEPHTAGQPVQTNGKKAAKPASRAAAGPTLVKDLRYRAHPDYTRLVFDLQRSVTFTQSREKAPDRVIIEIQNAVLSKVAKGRLSDGGFPPAIAVAQPNPRSVTIVLDLGSVSDYKLLPLRDPDRLVLDVYRRGTQAPSRTAAAPTTPPVIKAAPKPPPAEPAEPTEPAQPADAPHAVPASSPPPAAPKEREAVKVLTPEQREASEIRTIVIDPGHGGKDPGAIGRTGAEEKEITLRVALKLRDLIVKRLGKKVLMTRDRDVFIELEDRAKFANRNNADLFVSIHVNSHPQRAVKGLEVYHFGKASDRRALEVAARENGIPIDQVDNNPVNAIVLDVVATKKVNESQTLAWATKEAMVTRLDDHYDVVDHGVKTAPFYVLRFTTMPSILAEIAFISNPTEERLMRSEAFVSRMAEAIFEGVRAYVTPVQTVKQ